MHYIHKLWIINTITNNMEYTFIFFMKAYDNKTLKSKEKQLKKI